MLAEIIDSQQTDQYLYAVCDPLLKDTRETLVTLDEPLTIPLILVNLKSFDKKA